MVLDKWRNKDVLHVAIRADVWWCEGPTEYYIPSGTVDVESALALAFKAGKAEGYSEWAEVTSKPIASTHKDRSVYFVDAARRVAGLASGRYF